MSKDENLLSNLDRLNNHCQQIYQALVEDNENFAKLNMSAIDESNQRKKILVHQLEKIFLELNQNQPGQPSFMQRVENARNEANPQLQARYDAAIENLRENIRGCYEYITINTKSVHSRIHALQRTWDDLLATQPKMDTVYDNKGKKE